MNAVSNLLGLPSTADAFFDESLVHAAPGDDITPRAADLWSKLEEASVHQT